MRTTFKFFVAGASAIWIVLAAAVALAAPTKITFLHTNDVYETSPKKGQGGLAELMTLLEAERAAGDNVITTFGGDLISPSILSGLLEGAQMIELFNALKVDVAVPGNHEFDFGPEVAAKRIGESKFPWLGTNVLGPDGKPAIGMAASHMVTAGDFKVGFFGVLTTDTDTLSSPGPDISFAPVIETAKQAVAALQEAGADVIVALTHLEIAEDRQLVKEVKGINLVLGGHDHDPITFYERGVLIQKAGHDAHYLAVVDLTVDRVEKRGKMVVRVRPAWRMISTAGVTPEASIKAIVDGYTTKLDAELGQPVGTTETELDSQRSTVRTQESNFGNLIADAIREGVGADAGLANGGGIRGDRTYDAGTVLTRKDVLTELPFGNTVVLLELSGADLLAALENGVSKVEDGAGRFPQLSNMTLVYDPAAPAGSRIVEAKVGGATLDPSKTYTLATNSYAAGGGDGYAALKGGKVLIDASGGTLQATMVMDYITAKGTVAPKVEGRIRTK
jgi:5'-nucleotidase/UDP-sugar diphosphatase